MLGWAPACRLRWGMLQLSCAPSHGPHGISALSWAHTKPELKTEKEKLSVQGAKQDSSTLVPYSCRGDQAQALFFSSCILARGVQWGWLIPCWIPGCCRMLTCSARTVAECAGGVSHPFLVRQRRDSTCKVDFTRHQMHCGRMEIGSWSSFLTAQSSSWLLLTPQRMDGLII